MSSKSIHGKKFSDFMQLSNQHHQIKICEASHFCIILELVAYKLIFLLKQTGICVTKTARNVHFGNMKFTWKKTNSCSRCIFYLFLEIKKTACYLCDMLSNLFSLRNFYNKLCNYAMLKIVELHGPTKQYKTVIIC